MLRARIRKLPWKLRYDWGERIGSRFRRFLVKATHLHCDVRFMGPVRIGPGFRLYIPDNGTFIVGANVDFRSGFKCEISGSGRVEIGAGTSFTSNTLIQCSTSIIIGERCAFGQSSLIVDGYHRYRDPKVHWLDQGYEYRPIRIGDGAGVSDKCTVQADVGERAMVASGSVVNRPIPPFCLAVGAPARVVSYFGPPERRSELIPARAKRANADRFVPGASAP
jgi:acetyltransferase-like isoleucine patch superfamily enzyme